MKFLEKEIISNHNTIEEEKICVVGGNKKTHLGFFSSEEFFLIEENKRHIKVNKDQAKILKVTEFSKNEYSLAIAKYSKNWFISYKEQLISKREKYTAAVLTIESGQKLYHFLQHKIPLGWTVNCHHMTICLGAAVTEIQELMGKEVELKVTGYGYSEEHQVMSVYVESELYSKNENRHITVALNKENGAKAMNSNKIVSYDRFEAITLTANIDSVLNNGMTLLGSEQFKL